LQTQLTDKEREFQQSMVARQQEIETYRNNEMALASEMNSLKEQLGALQTQLTDKEREFQQSMVALQGDMDGQLRAKDAKIAEMSEKLDATYAHNARAAEMQARKVKLQTAYMELFKRELDGCTEALKRVKCKSSQDVREQRNLAEVVANNCVLLQGMSSVYENFLEMIKGYLPEVDDRSPSDQPAEEKDEDEEDASTRNLLSALQQKIETLVAVSAGYIDVEKQVAELEGFKSKNEERFRSWQRHEYLRETHLQEQAQQQEQQQWDRKCALIFKSAPRPVIKQARRGSVQPASTRTNTPQQAVVRRQSVSQTAKPFGFSSNNRDATVVRPPPGSKWQRKGSSARNILMARRME